MAHFLKGLRNYSVHRSLPFIGNTVSIASADSQFIARIELNRNELAMWSKWDPESKAYMEQCGSKIELRSVVAEHLALVKELYAWVGRQQPALGRYDITLLEEVKLEHDWVLSGGDEGRPRRFGLPE